jgi:two-component sensor histidine kinase
MTSTASLIAAAAPLVAAAGLLALGVATADVRVRGMAVGFAVAFLACSPWAGDLLAMYLAPELQLVGLAGGSLVGGVLAAALAFERLARPSDESELASLRRSSAETTRAFEIRQRRLRGLLKREHERLETVSEMHRYLELATRNSQITVFYQDADLRYRWIVNSRLSLLPADVIGRTDEEHLPPEIKPLVIGHKRRALATNTTQTFEIEVPAAEDRAWYRMDVVPISEDGRDPIGIVCTAIDITRSKRLDLMRTDLSRRLAETLQRFNLALRSERIVVFSQDTSLRYTWANSEETQAGTLVGRSDEEIIPEADQPPILALKRSVIETKRPASAEIGIGQGAERRWFDLHVEPNLKPDGTVAGITCASIDITHRKRNEEQLRLVMRELTHRTKNLLAVVIAIARQTSTQATTVEAFVPALIARLRALSAAQDLIVADDWAGVDITDLVHVLLGQYVPPRSARVRISGPAVILSPEASQNLGLAIHELAANAMRYGAFANATGTLEVSWTVTPGERGDELDLSWVESGGPAVSEPRTRGFGMMVIERNLSRALGAKVDMSFNPGGLRADIRLPLEGVMPVPNPDRVRLARTG